MAIPVWILETLQISEYPGRRPYTCLGPGGEPKEAGRLSLGGVGLGLEMDEGSQEQEHLQLLCFILFFFFFFFFSKNVTMKIPKIKPLPGPQPLLSQAPPPKRGPVGGGGGRCKEVKKKREKKTLSRFLFSQEAQESLRQ